MTTIADVARAAGVSVATVSRVMNHPDVVLPETRERVEEAIASTGYHPNRAAKALRTHHFSAVAVAVGDAANPFFARLVKAVQAVGDEHECTVMLYDLDHRASRLSDFIEILPRWGVDGAIIATGDDLELDPDFLEMAARLNATTPIVLGQDKGGLPAVVSDHRSAATRAVQHLAEVGVTRPVFVGTSNSSVIATERHDGFMDGVHDLGLQVTHPVECAMGYAPAYEAVLERAATDEFDGVVAANDQVAIGVLRALHDQGLHVPQDVAVIGFDGLHYAPYVVPSLSTMALDISELGRAQAEYLFGLLSPDGPPAQPPSVQHTLVVRESSRRVEAP